MITFLFSLPHDAMSNCRAGIVALLTFLQSQSLVLCLMQVLKIFLGIGLSLDSIYF